MPYFKWFGYDSDENPQIGYKVCVDVQELSYLLQQEGISYVHSSLVSRRFNATCSFHDRQTVLLELSQLLQAHIRLSQALKIISTLVKKEYIKHVLLACMRSVDKGVFFADIASCYPELFDPLTLHALKAGGNSGLLAQACTDRSRQLADISMVRSKVKSVVAMPLITAFFFIGIFIFLIIVILPQFRKIFLMLKADLPASTRFLLAMGEQITFVNGIYALAGLCALIICFLLGKKSSFGKWAWDNILLYVPFVGPLYQDIVRAQCLQSISLLLRSGQTLSEALLHVAGSFNNVVIKEQLLLVKREVQKGRQFSQAISVCPMLAVPEVENSVIIAHETAQLEIILQQLSVIFRMRALKKLDRITLMIQPTLLILLGAGIGMVLLALYLPLLQVPQNL